MPDGVGCDDGDLCTQSDTCQGGTCTGANPVACPAPDQCHDAGTCNPATGLCSNPAKSDGAACNDGDACTQTDTCQAGTCTGGNPVACPAPDQCHDAGTCNPGTGLCSNPSKPDDTGCNDGDACTQGDTCQGGTCTAVNPVVCTAQDQCHDAGVCDPLSATCSNPVTSDGTPCDDGDANTLGDVCNAGVCAGTPSGIDNFLCYTARTTTGTPPFSPIDRVTLVDSFNSVTVKVRRPQRLCAAADVGAGIFDPAALLESYRVRTLGGPFVRERGLRMTNLLGTFVVDTFKSYRVFMPTGEGNADAAPGANPYGCYATRLSRGQKFPKGLRLTVGAQFTPQPKIFKVKKPNRLCAPVSVDGRSVNPDDPFLLCFRVKGVRGQPKHQKVKGLAVHNEFGSGRLDTIRDRQLCLPTLLVGAEVGPAAADGQDD